MSTIQLRRPEVTWETPTRAGRLDVAGLSR